MHFIDLQAQYRAYQKEIDEALRSVLSSAQFIMGEEVPLLESELAAYVGSRYAISCSSGTDALLLALMALDIRPGNEVITTPFTFIATAEVIALLGAKPVFIDIDATTYTMDASLLEEAISDRTKAIIPVSLYGQPADMDEIAAIAARYDIAVIEDAAQSFGATYGDRKSCHLSKIGCTSFFPSKPLGAYGDGGAVFVDDATLAESLKMIRVHGQSKRYTHRVIGVNGRLDTMQAAVLRVKLCHFDDELTKRQIIAERYTEYLRDVVQTPIVQDNRTSAWAQYTIAVSDRERFIATLSERGIPTAVHYPVPLHLQEAFNYLGYKKGDFPRSEKAAETVVSLPMSPFLTEQDQMLVIGAVRDVVRSKG